ncbi:MAG: response regulator [Gammaproteobacteria bacterium]
MAQPLAVVVDDSPFLALHLARQLEECGFHAQISADAAELRRLMPEAALVCIELELFQASGFELVRELAEHCACPLVLLTGTGRNTDLQWGLRAGAGAVLQRPLCTSTLHSALAGLRRGDPVR